MSLLYCDEHNRGRDWMDNWWRLNVNVDKATKFTWRFLKYVWINVGTPCWPHAIISFYLFSLIDEDLKSVQPGNFERHWGIFEYDGKPKYALSLSSNGQDLVQASGVEYMTQQWCIYNPNSNGDPSKVGESITYACENSDCTSLGYGCSCNPYLNKCVWKQYNGTTIGSPPFFHK